MKPFLPTTSLSVPPSISANVVPSLSLQSVTPPSAYSCLSRRCNYNSFHRIRRRRSTCWALSSKSEYNGSDEDKNEEDTVGFDEEDEEEYLLEEIARLESLEDLLQDVKLDSEFEDFLQENDRELSDDGFEEDVNTLFELMEDDDDVDEDDLPMVPLDSTELEKALLEGVVPVGAGVGSDCLPGDWGFDPLGFASKDYVLTTQYKLLQSLPGAEQEPPPKDRPAALILRDYREAEIRHGRLAMLAAIFWPLQEMLDRLLLDDDQFSSLVYNKVTLPYFPLLMTLFMLSLGYLDIFAKEIQERDSIGDAYLPGDCFWDPLKILDGAPPSMKRNMQERELFNGRVAMLAIAAYFFEELVSGVPIISMDSNQLLFIPAYEIPSIQEWLDAQFSPTFR